MRKLNFFGWVIVILLIFTIIMMILSGCKASKDLHAYNRVKDSKILSEKIYREVLEPEHPCVVKDSIIRIEGQERVKYDTTFQAYEYHDTIEASRAIKVPILITKTIHKTDTLKIFQEDDRRLNLSENNVSVRDGIISEKDKDISEWKTKSHRWFWLFVVACGFIAAYTGIKIYSLFKPKI